jgi:hypothetical protein
MQPFANHEVLNLLVKERIDGWQHQAARSNQARFCWAIRFINWNKIRPDFAVKTSLATRRPVRG